MDLNYYFKWELLATVQQVWSFPRNFSGMQTADGRNCNYWAMGCRLLPLTASFYYSVRIFMGNGRRHTLNVLVRIFFFQWKFATVQEEMWIFFLTCEISVSTMSVDFSLSLECCQLQASNVLLFTFANVLLMPHGVFCLSNKTKIYGTHSVPTDGLTDFWTKYIKIIRNFGRKIYRNSYLISIFSFGFVHLSANCTHSLISPAVYFSGHCNWFRSKSESCFWGASKLRNYVLRHF